MFDKHLLPCALALFVAPAVAQCPDFARGFGRAGVNGTVAALQSFDDGTGPALYAGGDFTTAGDVHARFAARWQDLRWSSLGTNGPSGPALAYAVFDSGSGPELYAAGSFPSGIARWNGSAWTPLATSPGGVTALAVFDDGSGPALYATGYFTSIGALPANRIAKWNGTAWSALGTGLGGVVSPTGNCLAVFDDGGGPALYVGGHFDTAGGHVANGIAKWDGATWSALGTGMSGGVFGTNVYALLGASVGADPARLYAAGEFTSAGGVAANRIASWDGASWSPLGSGLNGYATSLALFDDGAGAHLYAGGGFSNAGGTVANGIARWNGVAWSALPADFELGGVSALAVHDDGTGVALYAGGAFTDVGGQPATNIARWTGSAWHPLGRGQGLDGAVLALTTFDDGAGEALYAGGNFFSASGFELHYAARWSASGWSPLGSGLNGNVEALQVFDDGSGPALYVGGSFSGQWSGGATLFRIARWSGTSWSPLANGTGGPTKSMVVFDDGTGPKLYAGGSFMNAGFVNVNNIARWDGSTWSALDGGVSGGSFIPGVNALAVFDDGSGAALYAGGSFMTAGTTAAKHIARWDGTTWSALGSGMNDRVLALTVFDDGTGPALYAGGVFTNAGGTNVNRVARWDGTSWSAAGSGLNGFTAEVRVLGVFDAGAGAQLVAGGEFSVLNGANLARLVGASWKPLGGAVGEGQSLDASVDALASFDDGSASGPQLYVGGNFQATGEIASHFLARMGCIGATVPFCFGSSIVGAHCPCFNADVFGNLTGCVNSLNSGAVLEGSGAVSLASDELVLAASGMTGSAALFFQGTSTVALGAGAFHGDGLMCAGGSLVRLRTQASVSGASTFPGAGDPSVSVTGGVGAPGTRVYQVVYRDATGVCTPNTVNLTNAVQVGWAP